MIAKTNKMISNTKKKITLYLGIVVVAFMHARVTTLCVPDFTSRMHSLLTAPFFASFSKVDHFGTVIEQRCSERFYEGIIHQF